MGSVLSGAGAADWLKTLCWFRKIRGDFSRSARYFPDSGRLFPRREGGLTSSSRAFGLVWPEKGWMWDRGRSEGELRRETGFQRVLGVDEEG